ncbi:unnamed protein product [Caenorhabditis nigoni]|nr:hypothetical protein B9Z55_015185 [Caenorhabditis nigoni]
MFFYIWLIIFVWILLEVFADYMPVPPGPGPLRFIGDKKNSANRNSVQVRRDAAFLPPRRKKRSTLLRKF